MYLMVHKLDGVPERCNLEVEREVGGFVFREVGRRTYVRAAGENFEEFEQKTMGLPSILGTSSLSRTTRFRTPSWRTSESTPGCAISC